MSVDSHKSLSPARTPAVKLRSERGSSLRRVSSKLGTAHLPRLALSLAIVRRLSKLRELSHGGFFKICEMRVARTGHGHPLSTELLA
jgi:hypothetical protein